MPKRIGLIGNIISDEDMKALSEWIATCPRLSKGPLTLEFERRWARWLGTKHAVFVNSGSSANLLMIYAMICAGKLKPGDKVVVPALSWSTDVAPLMQFGLVPVLCDCNLGDLSVDLGHLQRLFIEDRDIKALLLVSVLGLVPDMWSITGLCKEYGVDLLEDCCESMGSMFGPKNLGTFGEMSTFSMFFSHHISTIEGGMVCTDDDRLHDILVSIRAHG
jgi:CDP-6-deoxy-D-xylo-4-hexulose-3-dehydrase